MDLSFDSPTSHHYLTDSVPTAALLPLESPRLRNAPRRRFLYGWSTRSALRHMLSDSVQRLRYLDSLAPLATCRPLEPHNEVTKRFQQSVRIRPLRQVRYGMDENILASVAPEPAVLDSREPLQVMAPSLAAALPPMKPVWARPERCISLLKVNGIGCDGLHIPEVKVRPLQAAFVLGKAPLETAPGHSERRAVVIPFEELAAAAAPAKEKAAVLPLRRMSS